jgi:ribosomal protein L11 methyltransferase
MQFGKKLWICPSWCEIPDKNAVNVMLDPGLAFGTGTHPTTAMCLEYLDGFDIKGRTVIDYGCGSGILAIAALKLGAGKVIGIDIDPQAIQASRDNAVRNGVSENFELYLVDERPAGLQADLVVANILAGPLRELAPLLSTLVKDHGHIALSGILETQSQEINGIYGQWFDMTAPNIREEWCQLSGIKK